MSLSLPALFATSPWTMALKTGAVRSDLVSFDFTEVEPVFDGFPRVVRGEFAVAELALATFIQAVSVGAPLKLLPIALSQRVQHPSLVCHADRPLAPSDLPGKRIAVRSWGQTTGVWVRGLLTDRYGIDSASIRWVTFEDGHVRTVKEPSHCSRAPAGAGLLQMLESGHVDAAIFGSAIPDRPWIAKVIGDLPAGETEWRELMGYVPVNHAVVVHSDLAEQKPDVVAELISLFKASFAAAKTDATPPVMGKAAFEAPVRDCSRYLLSQNLIAEIPSPEQLFAKSA